MKRLTAFVFFISTFVYYLYAFTNPILPYDYSDPDVIRIGKYYMTYSTFASTPGLQILASEDGVNWSIVDAALPDTVPGYGHLDACPAGCGVWAPSIRYHLGGKHGREGRFYIYYGDPDIGIFCVRSEKTESIPCKWEPAVLVKPGKGLIDPCPLWDNDGRCYLVHAYAGSRAGFKSALAVCELTPDGLSVLRDDEIVFDGHPDNPTVEGPKFYKRQGYYYIFCPAGGVATGWQLCLRSRSPYGPYEAQRVLEQGTTDINGPHQGAWVDNWFWHFQDVGAAGRIVHLQPLRWRKGWPQIGENGMLMRVVDEKEETQPVQYVRDEFDMRTLEPAWQWSGNRKAVYSYANTDSSYLRLFTYPTDSVQKASNLLLRKIPANTSITFDARVRFTPNPKNASREKAGLIVHGRKFRTLPVPGDGKWWYARVTVSSTQRCRFYLSRDGHSWRLVGDEFRAVEGVWIGAKIGFYSIRDRKRINDAGYLDIDWVTITPGL